MQKTERIELRATGDFLDTVERLAADSNTSRADVIRRAVILYAQALKEAEAGRVLQFVPEAEARSGRSELMTGAL